MCGINGIISYKQSGSDGDVVYDIGQMNDIIYHRGPDDDGLFVQHQEGYTIGMGMRRLSIIDLAAGKQPIFSDDNNLVIVFNGEIYNFPHLRNDLKKSGVDFKTHSDTEVILKLYEQEGSGALHKLDGMFAFSIYDKRKNKLIIARDFFGEKPLYYTQEDGRFIWASELKSICKVLGKTPPISNLGLNFFFRLTYIPAPHTIYDNIFKLPANHILEYDLNNRQFSITSIGDEFGKIEEKMDFTSAKSRTKMLVRESVESRSISDVPIGTFLSGGVDSSIVSLCLAQMNEKPINTFSIGFKKKNWGETDKSQLVAKQIQSRHHEFIIGEDDLKHNIHEILLNFDEPFSDTAALPTYLVAKKTSEHVKVALTGDGGDEVFGGYSKYYVGKLNHLYTSITPKRLHSRVMKHVYPLFFDKDDARGRRFQIRKMLNSVDYNGQFYWDIISLANTEIQLEKLLKREHICPKLFDEYRDRLQITKPDSLTAYRFVDKLVSLEGGMLAKVDRTSMLNSLESRAPFLNRKLWEFTNGLPENFLMRGWNKKYLLKEAFRDEFPDKFLERSKQGFGSPVGDWLRSSLQKELESYVTTSFLERQNLFNVEYLQTLVKEHLSGKRDSTFQVWAFYCFQKWYCHAYEKVFVN